MSARTLILNEISRVALEHHKPLSALSDDTPLMETGLDSLCFAILVARLEDQTGVDPFGSSDEVALPVTVGDLVEAYDRARA